MLLPVLQKVHVGNKPGTVQLFVSTVVQIRPIPIFNGKHFSQLTLKSHSLFQVSLTSKPRDLLPSTGKKRSWKQNIFVVISTWPNPRQDWRDESENLIQFTVRYCWQNRSADGFVMHLPHCKARENTPDFVLFILILFVEGLMLLVLPSKKITWTGNSSHIHTHTHTKRKETSSALAEAAILASFFSWNISIFTGGSITFKASHNRVGTQSHRGWR